MKRMTLGIGRRQVTLAASNRVKNWSEQIGQVNAIVKRADAQLQQVNSEYIAQVPEEAEDLEGSLRSGDSLQRLVNILAPKKSV